MLIGIDGNEANVGKRVGIGEYACELLWQFYKISSADYRIFLKTNPRSLPEERSGWKYQLIQPKKLWTQIGLPFYLYTHRPKPDVFFSPTHYAPRFCPSPVVIAIMDLSYFHFPEMFKKSDLYQLKHWTTYSIKKATRVLAISQATKNDIIKHYHLNPGKIVVTYPGLKAPGKGDSNSDSDMETTRKKYGISNEYLLFVGTIQPRKNIARLIQAFSMLQSKNIDLVLVGKKGWLYEEILEAPKKFEVEDRVKFLDFVPDADLPILYRGALCFILPSLYEGFGLPVLEAMANDCPVITSNVSSLPEVAGDAAILVDPESIESIKEGIERLLNDKKLREELIEKGRQQVKKFSWEKCARETLAVLEEVGRGHV